MITKKRTPGLKVEFIGRGLRRQQASAFRFRAAVLTLAFSVWVE